MVLRITRNLSGVSPKRYRGSKRVKGLHTYLTPKKTEVAKNCSLKTIEHPMTYEYVPASTIKYLVV